MYNLRIEKNAEKAIYKLPLHVAEGFKKKFKTLIEDPYNMQGVDTIKNPKSIGLDVIIAYRIRVAEYRAIYIIEDEIITITIIEISHRSKVYRKK